MQIKTKTKNVKFVQLKHWNKSESESDDEFC